MDDNFLDKELLFNKKRKLEKGKEEESYTDLMINHVHKSAPTLLPRKRLSDSDFNFNVSTSDALNQSLDSNWELPKKENETNIPPSQDNLNFLPTEGIKEIENTKIIVNEPPDIPIVEEFDEQNDPYSFFNSKTLQYEFTPEGIARDNNSVYTYDNGNYDIIPVNSNDKNNRNEFHRQESSLIPFKQGSQVILFNNNNTGQVVLYNKMSKSLSIHKVRPLSKVCNLIKKKKKKKKKKN